MKITSKTAFATLTIEGARIDEFEKLQDLLDGMTSRTEGQTSEILKTICEEVRNTVPIIMEETRKPGTNYDINDLAITATQWLKNYLEKIVVDKLGPEELQGYYEAKDILKRGSDIFPII